MKCSNCTVERDDLKLSKKYNIFYCSSRCLRLQTTKIWNDSHKDYFKDYHIVNKEKRNLQSKNNYYKDPEKRMQQQYIIKRKSNIIYRIMDNLVTRTLAEFKLQNVQENLPILKMLGMNEKEFEVYLQSKFEPWMNWDNYGKGIGKWSIDHIKRLSDFRLSDIEQQKIACHYTNIQPLVNDKNSSNIK